jgi:hypothetical protein
VQGGVRHLRHKKLYFPLPIISIIPWLPPCPRRPPPSHSSSRTLTMTYNLISPTTLATTYACSTPDCQIVILCSILLYATLLAIQASHTLTLSDPNATLPRIVGFFQTCQDNMILFYSGMSTNAPPLGLLSHVDSLRVDRNFGVEDETGDAHS